MTNGNANVDAVSGEGRRYDREERCAEDVIVFLRGLTNDAITLPIISQLVRCATSVGANYCEADDSVSKKEFRVKIGICRKEAHECKHYLRMIAKAAPEYVEQARLLWREAKELHLIFSKIFRSCT